MMMSAIGVAAASAAGFALSTSTQHHAAAATPASARGSTGMVRHLAGSPLWWFGVITGGSAFLLHAVALHLGAIALVQPIIVSGVVLAVPVKALFNRVPPTRRELLGVIATATGLAVFLVVAHPSSGHRADPAAALELTVAAFVVVTIAGGTAGRVRNPARRSMLLGCAGGVLFGVVAGLLKMTTATVTGQSPVATLTGWPLWAMVVAGLGGVLFNQRAYRIAALTASMPALNTVNVLVALGFGLLVFGELPAHTATAMLLEMAALVCMLGGPGLLAAGDGDQPASEPPVSHVLAESQR